MKDINGKDIKIGNKVKTTQPKGGLFSPAPPSTGLVDNYVTSWGAKILCIKFRKENQSFDTVILLEGKINEIID